MRLTDIIQSVVRNDLSSFQGIPFREYSEERLLTIWKLVIRMERYRLFQHLLTSAFETGATILHTPNFVCDVLRVFSHSGAQRPIHLRMIRDLISWRSPFPIFPSNVLVSLTSDPCLISWLVTIGFIPETAGISHPLNVSFLDLTIGAAIHSISIERDIVAHNIASLFLVTGYSLGYIGMESHHFEGGEYLDYDELCSFALRYEFPVNLWFSKLTIEALSMETIRYRRLTSLMKVWIQTQKKEKEALRITNADDVYLTCKEWEDVALFAGYTDDPSILKLAMDLFPTSIGKIARVLVRYHCPKVLEYLWG